MNRVLIWLLVLLAVPTMSDAEQILEWDSKDPGKLVDLGVKLSELGEHQAALEAINQALEMDPGNQLAKLEKSCVLIELGRVEEAGKLLSASKVKSGSDREKAVTAYLKMCHIYRRMDKKQEALTSLKQGMRYGVSRARLLYESGKTWEHFSNLDSAYHYFTEALKAEPGNRKFQRAVERTE